MSSFNNLFILNSDKELELNKMEALKIDSLATLIKRDNGSKGDVGGRKKHIAGAEIYYIYLIHDIRSIYFNLPIKEREVRALKDSKLPENWKPDKAFEKAVKDYKEYFKLSAAGNAYIVAEKAYYTITEDTRELQDDLIEVKAILKRTIATLNQGKKDPAEIASLAADLQALYNNTTTTQKNIMTNIKSFSELGKNVKELATKFIEEGGNLKTPIGGGTLGNREV